jgi:CHAD domain-containing protein
VLAAIATDLEASGLLVPEERSKLQIGLELISASRPGAPRPPSKPGIVADDTMANAARKVLRMHLLRMLAAEKVVRQAEDVEGVHKMRVATRRMRAAWRVFDGAFTAKVQRKYVRELRNVAGSLGAVRDLDVQVARLDEYIGANGEAAADDLGPMRAEWRRRREDAESELLELIDSASYEKFVANYLELVDVAAETQSEGMERVRDGAGSRVWRAYEAMRAHEAGLQFADAAALHQLRIDGKRFRYTLEFFREVLPDGADALIAELTEQQDHLGLLNDAQVAAAMTREWLFTEAAALPPTARRQSAAYLAASEREIVQLRRSFTRLWRHLAGRVYRRRLALVISEI